MGVKFQAPRGTRDRARRACRHAPNDCCRGAARAYNGAMYPLRIAFEGYALIGLTLLIMASAILLFIVRQPQKDRGARLVCAGK